MFSKIIFIALLAVFGQNDAIPSSASNPAVVTPPAAFATSLGPCVDVLTPGPAYKISGCTMYTPSAGCTQGPPKNPSAPYPGCCPVFKCPFSTSNDNAPAS